MKIGKYIYTWFQPQVPHDSCNIIDNPCCYPCRLWFAGYRVSIFKIGFIKLLRWGNDSGKHRYMRYITRKAIYKK